LRAFAGAGIAAMPRVETSDAAAPTTAMAEKVRLLIIMTVFALGRNFWPFVRRL
jgi:hypothetical protein